MLPHGAFEAPPNELPDVVLLTETNASALLARRLGAAAAAILPVIDATCRGLESADRFRADVAIEQASPPAVDVAIHLLGPAVRRVRALPREILETDDPRMMLMARLFVRDRAMAPRSEVRARPTFVYDDESAIPGAATFAEQLTALGLMERKFVDKVATCPHCASARMTVREYCAGCGGANIVEQPIVHHFKCAYQGPERDFRRGEALVCPKCMQQLKNFSVDYDRPGSIGVCVGCGHLSSEHKVGFLCLDCSARVDARNVDSRTIYAYDLSAAGRACVAAGSRLPRSQGASVGARILAFAQRHFAANEPCCILFIRLRKPAGAAGAGDAWRQTCAFFGQMMRECFIPETEIIEQAPIFLALLGRDRKAEVELRLPEIRARLVRHLALAPTIELAVFAPEDVPGLGGRARKVA